MVRIDKSVCDECCTCISVCPENALTFTNSLFVDPPKCISCSKCVDICPFGAIHLSNNEET